nr:IS30 family transposase [Glycomyces buryatensis]
MLVPDTAPISPRFLTQDDRIAIADGLHADQTVKVIAASIDKSYQTVYREIGRNSKPDGRYQPWWAHNQALLRRSRPKEHKIRAGASLRKLVRDKLNEQWSPQQVARPAEVEDRRTAGHWEGDLIIGRAQSSAIGTLVERTTRYLRLIHLPGGWKAPQVRNALVVQTADIPWELRRTLTWDQGRELTLREDIEVLTGFRIYFCDPHSPWQRGANENTNGLLRQYFPKGTDLAVHTARDLQAVARQLNTRPRLVLGDKTPEEAMREWSKHLSPS